MSTGFMRVEAVCSSPPAEPLLHGRSAGAGFPCARGFDAGPFEWPEKGHGRAHGRARECAAASPPSTLEPQLESRRKWKRRHIR